MNEFIKKHPIWTAFLAPLPLIGGIMVLMGIMGDLKGDVSGGIVFSYSFMVAALLLPYFWEKLTERGTKRDHIKEDWWLKVSDDYANLKLLWLNGKNNERVTIALLGSLFRQIKALMYTGEFLKKIESDVYDNDGLFTSTYSLKKVNKFKKLYLEVKQKHF